jgi:formiminotetrahydrofolate cyclodeaminase
LTVARGAIDGLRLASTISATAPRPAASDLAVAVHLAWAALQGAAENILINARAIRDPTVTRRLEEATATLRRRGRVAYRAARRGVDAINSRSQGR